MTGGDQHKPLSQKAVRDKSPGMFVVFLLCIVFLVCSNKGKSWRHGESWVLIKRWADAEEEKFPQLALWELADVYEIMTKVIFFPPPPGEFKDHLTGTIMSCPRSLANRSFVVCLGANLLSFFRLRIIL